MKLTKTQETARAQLTNDLRAAKEKVEGQINQINMTIANELAACVTHYNETLEALKEFRDETVTAMDEAFDDKSEKWQEGEKGQALLSLKDEWEGVDLDAISDIEEIEMPEMDHADNFDALPSETEE